MAENSLARFVRKLHDDSAFRSRFAADPGGVLREFDLDPALLDLPERIDLQELEDRIAAAHRGNARWTLPDAEDAKRLTADELWERFHFIRLRPDANFAVSVTASISGVIYGTTATTSTTITSVGGGGALTSFEQITRLRGLSRLPKHELRFTIASPDGLAVADLNVDAMRALLARLT